MFRPLFHFSMHRTAARLFAFFSTAAALAAQEVLDGIAAVVNQDVITFSDVRQLVGPKEKSIRAEFKGQELVEKVKEVRLQAINDLIDRQLILQEFKTNKFQLPEYVIDERVQTIVREEFGGDRSAFLRTLAAQDYTLEKFKEQQRDVVIVQEMRRMSTKGGATVITEDKIQKAYRGRHAEFSTEEQIKLRLIAIKLSGANDSRRKMIEEIRAKVVEGAEFGDLARMYSEDPTQETGGDWGWINRKQLNEKLTKLAFALKPGQVSDVVEMAGSYYLLYVEAAKPGVTKPLKEVREQLEKDLQQQERQKAQQEWLAKLRKKAFVKVF